jgi:lysophospholipase L1-like esterase
MHAWLLRFSLIPVALVVGLLVSEGLLRLATEPTVGDSDSFFLGQDMIFDPVLGWKNQPGTCRGVTQVDGRWVPLTHEVNRLGFRGPEISPRKPQGTTRIVCMGDSGTFGVLALPRRGKRGKIKWRAITSYPDALRERLEQEGRHDVEVINAGVIGYSSAHALRQLMVQLLDLAPDILTLRLGINDSVPSWAPRRPPLEPSHPLTRFLLYRFHDWRTTRLVLRAYQDAERFHPAVNSVPWATTERFRYNVERIVDEAQRRGIRVIFLDYPLVAPRTYPRMPELQQAMLDVASAHGVPVLETSSKLLADGAGFYDPLDGVHLNERGARLLAELLHQKLLALGWIRSNRRGTPGLELTRP